MIDFYFWLAVLIFGGGSFATLAFIIWRDYSHAVRQKWRWIKNVVFGRKL